MNKSLFLFALLILLASNGICQNITADTTLANTYIEQAKHFIKANNNDSSNIFYKNASDIYLKLCKTSKTNTKQDTIFAERYLEYQNQIGRNLQDLQKIDSSIFVLKNTLKTDNLFVNQKNKEIANIYHNIGRAYYFKWMLDSALNNYNKSLAIRLELFGEMNIDVATSYNNIGVIYDVNSEYDRALEFYYKSLEIRKKILGEISSDVANSYNNVGVIYTYKAEYDKAIEYFVKSNEIQKELFGENNPDVASSYNNIGIIYYQKAEYDKALKYYFKSIEILKELLGEKHPEIAIYYSNIGIIYYQKAEYDIALEYQTKSLEIQKELFGEIHPDVAVSYIRIGNIYNDIAEYNKALEYYFKSLDIQKVYLGEDHVDVASNYNNIGNVYYNKAEYNKALDYYFKSLNVKKILFGENHYMVAESYNNIGVVYHKKEEYNLAIKYLFDGLKIQKEQFGEKHPEIACSYNNIASVYFDTKQNNKSLKYYHLGMVSNMKFFNDTINIFNIPTIKNYLNYTELIKSLQEKAKIYAINKTDLKLAFRYYQACDTLIDQTRQKISKLSDKIALGETAHQVYSGAIAICLKMGSTVQSTNSQYYSELAFTYSEKNKGMVLLEALAGQESLKFAGIPDSLLEKEHTLKTDITFYEKQLAEKPDSSTEANYRSKLFTTNRQYEELIARFEKQYPDYYNLKYTSKIPTVKDIQNLLDKQTALRSYLVGDSVIYIYTITKKELNVVQVPKMEHFDDSLKYFRYGLTFTSPRMKEYYRRLGYSFYQQLFPDVLDKNIKNIIIVPDGNLGIIPFESLLTTNYSGDIDNYKDYPYLIKKYNISYSYSANLYARTFSKDKTKDVEFTKLNDWLAFAPVFSDENKSGTALISSELRNAINKSTDDSLMTRGTLISGEYINPLPGTELETQNIFNLFNHKNKKAQLLLYDKANENYLKSGKLDQFRIIHFATHGFVNSEKPELSGIILNQDTTGGEDGILYSGELYNLKMNADLVVLSACETGLGKIRKGEGIIGLTRALLYAGAKNIVVSLWQVSDKSTSDLMIDFYKNLTENEKQNHSKSLQQAKLKMINESNYAHPFYWSPFILIGK